MKKLLKYGLYGFAGVLALLVLAVAVIAATFNPNDYKPLIIKLVQEKKQRTLHLEGDIKLAFWPKIGADLGKLSISEHNSEQTFASIQGAKVALALLPLLKKELVVDTIYIDGAQANIIKYKDGTTNFDDLLSKDEEESEQIKFDVDGVKVTNSAVTYSDEGTGAKYALSKFNLSAGHVALAQPFDLATDFSATANQPAVAVDVKLKGNFLADPEAKHFAAKGLDATIKGDVAGGKDVTVSMSGDVDAKPETREFLIDSLKLALTGQFDGAKVALDLNAPALVAQKDEVTSKKISVSLSQEKASDSFKANLVLADIKGSPKALQSSGISGDISGTQGKRSINGKFSSPFQGNLESLIFDLPKFAGNIDIKDPAIPNGSAKVNFDLSLHADAEQEQVHSKFLMNVDNTKLNGNVALANFKKPNIQFNLTADALDLNKLLGAKPAQKAETKQASTASQKPADMSALGNLLLDGKINIGQISYDKYRLSGLNVNVKADGQKLALTGLNVKFDDSQIKGGLGISQFHKPLYSFDLDIDQLNLDKYVIASDKPATETKASTGASSADAPLDLSALKALNANGSIRIGNLRYGKTKASNVRVDLKAADGVATIAPLSANLYQGSMNGSLKVDARSTPSIAFKQDMKGIAIGPLLVDAINNDMLDGKGALSLDVTASGNTVGAMKKALNGTSSLQLADGAVKGIDIAGTIRNAKSKINIFKDKSSIGADQTQKTDFSELTASFNIKNGVAHNEDLAMKAPILRLAKGDSRGDIDIANENINYLAKPTIVKSLKGQGGAELDSLAGVSIPVKVTGTFSAPKYGIDFAALGTAIAKSNLIDKIGGDKAGAVKALVGGEGNKVDALKGLLNKDKPADKATAPADGAAEQPKSAEQLAKEKAEEKLKKMFKF
ncbi:AsmA family protein [Methylotenera mobilis]|uniref:AsmA family protein n=1 Tax=Methylotenera mobilis (strain JLW8 / ATCC BAA-1282 / DSM 17540) TaxID=583345 RepID=C6WY44_METML|nr:AsmA family protein [Methylotenera mobilis]ACT46940.1 AsmA family protein [Methylotenera mobilis JLW8]